MTPTYDIFPGDSIGPFKLGDTLWSILEMLRTEKVSYPKVEASWDESQPHKSAISIQLPNVNLHFPSSPTQSLGQITVTGLSKPALTLKYDNQVLCAPRASGGSEQKITRGLVGKTLGPTYDVKGSVGELMYPGISFHIGGKKGGGGDREDVVDEVIVCPKDGETVEKGLTSCIIMAGRGIALQFSTGEQVEVILGQTTHQDLLLDLGAPLRRFWKEDERMEKMWGDQNGSKNSDKVSHEGDSFLNYFQYGLDFLISSDGLVKKIITYSNIPGSPLFQRYAKCPWTISAPTGILTSTSPISSFHTSLSTTSISTSTIPSIITTKTSPTSISEHLTIPIISGTSNSRKSKKRSASANSDQSSVSVAELTLEGSSIGVDKMVTPERHADGMMLDRVGEGGLEGVTGEMRSRLVGFEGIIVEEDLASGGTASVLIYKV